MKKFIVPVINLIALVLSAVVFGLGANTSVVFTSKNTAAGNWYQLVWTHNNPLEVIPLVGFFLFCVAVFVALVTMLPFKGRKFCVLLAGLMFVGAGVMFLMTPNAAFGSDAHLYSKTDSLIAMAVLVFVAGGLEVLGSCVELLPEKK